MLVAYFILLIHRAKSEKVLKLTDLFEGLWYALIWPISLSVCAAYYWDDLSKITLWKSRELKFKELLYDKDKK